MDTPATNTPEFTVSEISGAVKRTLETTFGRIRVRGELTEVKRYPSGHIYLSLKDENSKISGVVWKTAVSRLGMVPENGTEVIATGRISAYGERSSYQLIIERMEYAGVGALLARIELIRQRLTAEGLFDAARKLPLPTLPTVIGVVTSEKGAVIQDIRTTIERRFPRRILLWPVPVQGENAAQAIADAIAAFDAMAPGGDPPRPDVLIVGRGGGSLEDLMPFNEEIVVRAAAACRIPLISAVGHETDTTLIDYVSDRRAPTPTAAAEMAIPARADLIADLVQRSARLIGALNRLAQNARLHLSRVERGIPDLPSLLSQARQRLDDRAERAFLALPALVGRRRADLTAVERRLPDPHRLTARARDSLQDTSVRLRLAAPGLVTARRNSLDTTSHRLTTAAQRSIALWRGKADRVLSRMSDSPLRASLREARAHLSGLAPRLEAASPLALLQRGYVLVTTPAGQPVTAAKQVKPNDALRLHFGDGEINATVQDSPTTDESRRAPPDQPARRVDAAKRTGVSKASPPLQGSLDGMFNNPPQHGLFFALRPDAIAVENLTRLMVRLRTDGTMPGKPVDPDRLHLTLLSLGNFADQIPPSLIPAAQTAAATVRIIPFEVVFDRIGGTRGALLLRSSDKLERLKNFRQALTTALMKAGLRRHIGPASDPHITLSYDFSDTPEMSIEPISWTVREFVLIESRLGKHDHNTLDTWSVQP